MDVKSNQDLLSPECSLFKKELSDIDYSQKLHDRVIHFKEITKIKLETEIKEKADNKIKEETEVYKKRNKLLEDKLKECAPLLDSIDITNQMVSEERVREKVQEELERRTKSEGSLKLLRKNEGTEEEKLKEQEEEESKFF